KIANFVVKSRLRFARNSYFSRKFKVTKFATSQSAGTLTASLQEHTAKKIKMDSKIFAEILKKVKFDNKLKIGKFILEGSKGIKTIIQYNQRGFDLLENKHEYTFPLSSGDLEVSLQFYANKFEHYRLFCFTSYKGIQGMVFSLNLTTQKETDDIIFLTQKIKFAEQYKGNEELAQAHRRQKQIVICEILKNIGIDVTENNDVILGIFNPSKKSLENTTIEKFLNDFIVIAILKGHFQGNKGYKLEILPNYNILNEIENDLDSEIEYLPIKIVENKTKRNIPLSIRYKILERDNFKCTKCGRNVSNGIKLQVDHKNPFSRGGLTEIKNLQTLCNECNLGKSNKYVDK
ncbi:HNH endonuclease, partial [Flavobacterium psychrophilum]